MEDNTQTRQPVQTMQATQTTQAAPVPGKPKVLLGGTHISKAISDPGFFALMPEFASIRAQIRTMHVDPSQKKGCGPCARRRLHANIDGNFAAIAASLPEQRAKVLKKYLGMPEDQALLIRAINPATRQIIMKQF